MLICQAVERWSLPRLGRSLPYRGGGIAPVYHGCRRTIAASPCRPSGSRSRTMPENGRSGGGEVAFVVSLNLTRRHLTPSQRAAIAAELATAGPGRPKTGSTDPVSPGALPGSEKNPPDGGVSGGGKTPPSGGVTQSDAADKLNVGLRSVQRAEAVRQTSPELHDAVKRGDITVADAADAVKTINELPPEKRAGRPPRWSRRSSNGSRRKRPPPRPAGNPSRPAGRPRPPERRPASRRRRGNRPGGPRHGRSAAAPAVRQTRGHPAGRRIRTTSRPRRRSCFDCQDRRFGPGRHAHRRAAPLSLQRPLEPCLYASLATRPGEQTCAMAATPFPRPPAAGTRGWRIPPAPACPSAARSCRRGPGPR